MSQDQQKPSPPGQERSGPSKYAIWGLFALLILFLLAFIPRGTAGEEVSFSQYLAWLRDSSIERVDRNNNTGEILFERADDSGQVFVTSGPVPASDEELELLSNNVPATTDDNPDIGKK